MEQEQTQVKDGVLTVEIFHEGTPVHLPVRVVTVVDEELVEDTFPEPPIPTIAAASGQKIPDLTNDDYLQKSKRVDRTREVARVALALLPGHPLVEEWTGGATTLEAKVAKMRERMQLWEVVHLSRMIRVPRKMTEEDVQREMLSLYPTLPTATEK